MDASAKAPSGKSRKVKMPKLATNPTEIIDHEKKTVILRYESTTQLRENFEQNESLKTNVGTYLRYGSSEEWIKDVKTPEQAIRCATEGLENSVPVIMEERKRAEKLDVQIQFPSWQADIAGAFPCVPDFLAGSPECMRRMVNRVQDTRPIRIFVGMASSAGFASKALERRGALISAMALQLSKTRQVEVYSINSGETRKGGDSYAWSVMVKLPRNTSARDMSYWLCNQASVRGLLYAAERFYSGPLSWPAKLSDAPYFSEKGIANHAYIWGAKDTDIVIPFPYLEDAMAPEMILDPSNWMRNTLKRVNAL